MTSSSKHPETDLSKVVLGLVREHRKASERYIDVSFNYPDEDNATWEGSVPIEYRWTGVNARSEEEISNLVAQAYEAMRPSVQSEWLEKEEALWSEKKSAVTSAFFAALADGGWKCRECELPSNPNFARRIQALKEMGYTLATNTGRYCTKCGGSRTHLQLLRLPRASAISYETWPPGLRERIVKVLHGQDVYENGARDHLLPDHKFPEVRWDATTAEENPSTMSDEEIRNKFQLLSNQRNEQKREVCRRCFQTGERGQPFGIRFFYEGGAQWPESVAKTGSEARAGCVGCGWFDLAKWRLRLNESLGDGTLGS